METGPIPFDGKFDKLSEKIGLVKNEFGDLEIFGNHNSLNHKYSHPSASTGMIESGCNGFSPRTRLNTAARKTTQREVKHEGELPPMNGAKDDTTPMHSHGIICDMRRIIPQCEPRPQHGAQRMTIMAQEEQRTTA